MNRRDLLRTAALGGAGAMVETVLADTAAIASTPLPPFEWEEATLVDLSTAMAAGKLTSAALTRLYLDRIESLDKAGPALNSVIEINPDALAIAQDLDAERKSKGPRGPLHGIPILIKDNIATHDRMMTTAGSLALLGSIAPRDSFVAGQLRKAGAVILGKTNLSEWANFRANGSTSGWSGRGGMTKNPYALDRNPSGSSSGSAAAVSANFCALSVGTETDGSIVSPSSFCGIVGIKPTVGLISRSGIIPISSTQDTAGPMARTVTDAALLLSALAGPDPHDPASEKTAENPHPDYTRFLDRTALQGARLGVARQFFQSRDKGEPVISAALATLRDCGAVLIDPVDLPTFNGLGRSEFQLMLYEFKAGLNAYFAALGDTAPVHSLAEVIDFNLRHAKEELPWFGQNILLSAQAKGPLTEKEYVDAREECRTLSRARGIDAVMDHHHLDAIIAPTGGPADKTDLIYGSRGVGGCSSPAAIAGYPHITLPAGEIFHLPVGLSFFGRAYSEPTLLKLAYSFEQATKAQAPEVSIHGRMIIQTHHRGDTTGTGSQHENEHF